jgi:NAD(P)-dependent dehydrogenase (short-subunit alcohol dehydrogenase family)
MREIERQTILVTGATDGLGRALAADLAGRGATVLLHGRDDERGRAALDEVRRATGSERLGWYRADLSSLEQVRELAAAVRRDHERLHCLVNNAGIGTTVPGGGVRQESADAHEQAYDPDARRRLRELSDRLTSAGARPPAA